MIASIVVLCKNRKLLSEYCIKSILNNTDLQDSELIVIDAGSVDGLTESLIKRTMKIKDRELINHTDVFINLPQESKVFDITKSPSYFNLGINMAKGKYIVKIDGDIVVQPGWLDELIALVNIPNVAVSSYFFAGNGSVEHIKARGLQADMLTYGNTSYISTNIINGGIWVLKREILDRVGGYNIDPKWGGALDSGFSAKIDMLKMQKVYGINRKAIHIGGQFSIKDNKDKIAIVPDSFYSEFIKKHYPAIYAEYN